MELEFIRWLREHVPADPRAKLGLRDDAALLSVVGNPDVVVTTDLLTDGVDFRVGHDDLRRIGRQALGANLSDLAAMAAKPLAAFISVALPHHGPGGQGPLEMAIGLYEGLLPLASGFDIAIAGGDTNTFDGPLVISVTAIGQPLKGGALTRSGGKPGDWLLVTGSLGGSLLGHMFDFTPRVREAMLLHDRYQLAAGIDISDGLAIDASRIAEASGCGAVIFTDRVPVSADAVELAKRDGADDVEAAALAHALGDGQDFELLFAVSPKIGQAILNDRPVECRVTHVGELVAEAGLWQQTSVGTREPERKRLEATGWRHE
jgi:thiamine-monophosphate kinase